jgi:SAM-dependent methyltransferase
LSPDAARSTRDAVTQPELFDRAARRRRRDRAAAAYADHAFLRAAMLDGIADRLDAVSRSFTDILDLGAFDGAFQAPPGARVARLDPGFAFARAVGGVQADEDRPPFADGSFDLIVSAGVLDSVNDLPGALTLARRMLRPDGLLLAAFVGGDSLAMLRQMLIASELRPAARAHPRIDVRSAGDLLVRAGFALPVADTETLEVSYAAFDRLLADLRGMAAGNVLRDRQPLLRGAIGRAAADFAARATAQGGRVTERFDLVFLTGWAPSPDQPKPARRGSGTASLAAALRPPSDDDSAL